MLKSIAIVLAALSLPQGDYPQSQRIAAAGLYAMCGEPGTFGMCYGYALAVADMYDPQRGRFCIDDVAPSEVVEAIHTELHGKPDLHFTPAAQAVILALDTHFPC